MASAAGLQVRSLSFHLKSMSYAHMCSGLDLRNRRQNFITENRISSTIRLQLLVTFLITSDGTSVIYAWLGIGPMLCSLAVLTK